MASRRNTDKVPAGLAAARRRTYEYHHQYGLELSGREEPRRPKKKPAPDPKKKA